MNCDLADSNTVQEIQDQDEFVCKNAECRKPLEPENAATAQGKGGFKPPAPPNRSRGVLVLIVLALVLIVSGWMFYRWQKGNPRIEITPATVEFPFQKVGGPAGLRKITITNHCDRGTLEVTGVRSSSKEFSVNKEKFTLEAGQTVELEITFTSIGGGNSVGEFVFSSNDRANPEKRLQVSGCGGKLGAWWIWEELEKASKAFPQPENPEK